MAKIPDLVSPLFNPLLPGKTDAQKAKEKKNIRESRGPRFSSILAKAAAEALPETAEMPELPDSPEEAATILQDAVQSAGDDLRKRPFPEEIRRYKQAVRNFLRYVMEKGYTTERQIGIPQYLRHGYKGPHGRPESHERKTYTMIQVVDEKLEQLAAGILTGQTSQKELLARLEEISGILIDLLN